MATILERNKNIKTPKKTYAEHMEDALYREVWEDVNNEKTMRFIKKYSRHIIYTVIFIMLVASGIQIGMRAHQSNKVATAIAYETALSNLDSNALASLSDNSSGATADLALFQSYLLDKDEKKLEKLAENGHSRDFRDLARIHLVAVRGNAMSAPQVEEYLSELTTKDSPYYYNAMLLIAQKYLSVGEQDVANKWLDRIINDESAPASITGVAQTLR